MSQEKVAEIESHVAHWKQLTQRYLPIESDSSIWRYSRVRNDSDIDQGWKLHISANILTANKTFVAVASYLTRRGVLFKAPCSLQELHKLNSGFYYGYSQVGKFITIYPQSPEQARTLAVRLHKLTYGLSAPIVPFDCRFAFNSNVYYRYGSFKPQSIDGRPVMKDENGILVPDSRYGNGSVSKTKKDPLKSTKRESNTLGASNLSTTPYRALRAISQRGKGGVYKAVDLSVVPERLCIIKQGRNGGEITWTGHDGRWLVKNEATVLSALRTAGVEVPEIYSKFRLQDDHFLVLEFIEGETLESFLLKRQRRLSLTKTVKLLIQACVLLESIHEAGWVWRDCKPSNLILTSSGTLRPLDFEGASALNELHPVLWQTRAFMSPLGISDKQSSPIYDDIYSLGVLAFFLVAGRMPESKPKSICSLRRNIPEKLRELIAELMHPNPRCRPAIKSALSVLASI